MLLNKPGMALTQDKGSAFLSHGAPIVSNMRLDESILAKGTMQDIQYPLVHTHPALEKGHMSSYLCRSTPRCA